MHRFLIDPDAISNNIAPLDANEAQHALKVLRLYDGSPVEAMDGRGSAWRGVLRISGGNPAIELGQKLSSTDAPLSLTVYLGLPKGEKLEFVAQKLCEIGAKKLVPVRMERCVAKIAPSEAEKKLSRPRRIALEAQKQSGRQSALEICDPIDTGALAGLISSHERAFLLWENARNRRLKDVFEAEPALGDIAAIVGPEGGISEKEAMTFADAGAVCISLGPRILRAETAAIVAAAEILTLWGDL